MLVKDPDLLAAIGPRVRKSPFFDATVAAGLTAVSTYNHMWLPMSYGDADEDYRRLTERVSMWDVSAQRHVQVSGSDATALTQLVTAVDISGVDTGHGLYAPMVDHDGRLVNDPVLLRWFDGSWRFSIADADIRLWTAAVAAGSAFDAEVCELDTSTIAVQGPRAFDVTDVLDFPWARDLAPFEMRRARVEGIDLVVSRSGWSNEDGVELFIDGLTESAAERLWNAIAAAGAHVGIGPGAPHPTERLENTFLSYGTDTGYDADPLEVGLDSAIDIDGPAFVGQDALKRIRERGPERRLRGVVIAGDPIEALPHPTPFVVGENEVGQLRAANSSPRFGRNIGLVLVNAADAAVGTVGSVYPPGGERRAEIIELPFAESLADLDRHDERLPVDERGP